MTVTPVAYDTMDVSHCGGGVCIRQQQPTPAARDVARHANTEARREAADAHGLAEPAVNARHAAVALIALLFQQDLLDTAPPRITGPSSLEIAVAEARQHAGSHGLAVPLPRFDLSV